MDQINKRVTVYLDGLDSGKKKKGKKGKKGNSN